jgi:hypothetical protein
MNPEIPKKEIKTYMEKWKLKFNISKCEEINIRTFFVGLLVLAIWVSTAQCPVVIAMTSDRTSFWILCRFVKNPGCY